MKLKWYLQTWFIVLLAVLWPLYIPPIIALFLLIIQIQELNAMAKIYGEKDAIDEYVRQKEEEADNIIQQANVKASNLVAPAQKEAEKIKALVNSLKEEEKNLRQEIEVFTKAATIEAINLKPYDGLSSEECKDKLAVLRMKQEEFIKADKALVVTSGDPKKVLNNNIKQLLRCFNSESKAIISNVTAKNVESARGNLKKSFEALNKIFSTDGIAISYDLLEMKLEELNIVYAAELKKEEEKEIQKAIREQMLEEEKVRKEIERQKAKIEKEETQFKNEANKLMKYLQSCTNDVEKNLYIDKIKELEDKLKLLEKDKENVLQREQNTRAGFVYIISNLGAFGEDVYKIGMTRRLEPMDRIKELGDASVPFPFDVHAIIFSEDAPALESILHQTFRQQEVNKVNSRKEFFKVSLNEIKDIVTQNYNATVHFIDIPDAMEYRESLRISEQKSA